MDLSMRYYGDPILREEAKDVTEFDDELRELAVSMVDKMHEERGIGLAGPQVGKRLKLIVALKMSDAEDTEAEAVPLVNPVVLERSKETWEFEEGCLSIPKLTGNVTRAESIVVRYQDLDGEEQTIEADGMFARVLLHEIDHLHGKLFIDYLSAAKKSLLKPQLKEIAEKYAR